MMRVWQMALMGLLLLGCGTLTPFAVAQRLDNELPDLQVEEDWDTEQTQEAKEPESLTHYYYDFRSSEKFCLSAGEARAKRLLPQGRMKACKK